ncbi:MAG: TonB-dependent receptor [Bacteroidales bacterium]|nr:TonB-dependent receptor [Bacteroidales bacterium]
MKQLLKRAVPLLSALLLLGAAAWGQTHQVSGKVTDASTGEPVPGAAVLVKGGTGGTVTDVSGIYSLAVAPDATLVCSCIGFSDVEMPVGGRAVIDFSLKVDAEMLEETVVVGYGTLKKSQLVGSVENVSGEVLEDRSNSNITRSLQGEVAGLNIIQSDGKPTHGGAVYIRGGATSYVSRGSAGGSKTAYSIGQGGGALVLIDGVEGEMASVNPNDVESISVLKDASSSVIYGARAAYGVILITTKNAKEDKISVNYSGSVSVNTRTVRWEDRVVTDGLTFVENFYEHWLGHDATPQAEGKLPTKMNIYQIPSDYLERYRQHVANGDTNSSELWDGRWLYYSDTNYIGLFYKPVNTTTTHNISVNGTSGKVSYGVSGRYYTQDAIYKLGNESYGAYNLRAKLKLQINNWLSIDNNTSMYKMDYTQPIFSKNDGNVGSQLRQIAMMGIPCIPVFNEDGTYTVAAAAGGYAAFNDGNSSQEDHRLTVTTASGITIEPFKDVFNVRGEFAFKSTRRGLDRYVAPVAYSVSPGAMTDYVKQVDSYYRYYDYNTEHITANIIGTFTPKLGENHNLNLVAGWNLEDNVYHRRGVFRTGILYPDNANFELMDGQEVELVQDGSSYGIVGFFGRANYSLLRRYIFEVSARYDGSSKFPTSQRWGFFPSASIGWRISEEPWMKSTRGWLDNLKLRANAGSLGNGTVAAYAFLTTLGINKTGAVFDGSFQNKVSDPSVIPDNLTWEKVTTYDAGLDADFLRSRLSFSGDYYIRNTTDLYIAGPEIPATFGDSTPKGNYGALQTRGWELTLSWRDQVKLGGKDFSYSVKGSLWDSRTWVTKYYNKSGGMFNYYEGKELGEIWGFRTDGLFLTNEEAAAWYKDEFHNFVPVSGPYAGDIKFVDLKPDKVINTGSWTLKDHGDLDRIGNEAPRYQFGLNLDFRWNGIGLSAFFQGVGKRDWYPSQGTDFFWGSWGRAYAYMLKDQQFNHVILDKSDTNWKVANAADKPFWPRQTYGTADSATGALTFPSDYFLMNAAYVRLKTLTLDYSFPKALISKAGIQQLRVYVTGENLFTWSPMFKYTTMFDPEVIGNGDSDFHSGTSTTMGDGYSYPLLRSVTFGISLTL